MFRIIVIFIMGMKAEGVKEVGIKKIPTYLSIVTLLF